MTKSYGVASFLSQSDVVGIVVLSLLLLMSVASWYLIAIKIMRNARVARRARLFLDRFWSAPSIDRVMEEVAAHPAQDPFTRLASQGLDAARHYRRSTAAGLALAGGQDEFITRAIRRAIVRETASLESGLTVLASVGSTAPFVGLFGTVWGIYHALIGIGSSGKATLDSVAGPVGEALIMTAAGLAVAIPAVLAYNAFARSNRLVLSELDGFAHDLHAFLVTGAKLNGTTAARDVEPAMIRRAAGTKPVGVS